MVETILELLKEILKAIPFIEKHFMDTPFENEQEAKKKIDEEHKKNNEDKEGRPSGDFWEGDRP